MTYAPDELQQSSFVALFNVHAVLKVYIIPLGILSHYNMGGGVIQCTFREGFVKYSGLFIEKNSYLQRHKHQQSTCTGIKILSICRRTPELTTQSYGHTTCSEFTSLIFYNSFCVCLKVPLVTGFYL